METHEEINILLDTIVNGKTFREMSGREFCLFCLSKMNNIGPFDYEVIRLSKYLNNFKCETMLEESKIDILTQLRNLNLYG